MIAMVRWKVKVNSESELLIVAESDKEEAFRFILNKSLKLIELSLFYGGVLIPKTNNSRFIGQKMKISVWFTIEFKDYAGSQKFLEVLRKVL